MLRVTSAEDASLGLSFLGVSRDPGGLPDGKDQGAGVDGESRSSVGHTAQVLSLGQPPQEVSSCFCLRVQKCKARPPLTNNNCWSLLMAGAKLFAMSLRFEFRVSNRVYDTDVKFQQNALSPLGFVFCFPTPRVAGLPFSPRMLLGNQTCFSSIPQLLDGVLVPPCSAGKLERNVIFS